ncbi:aldo/keto reductase-like protein [Delitschia confertaspora ATCC 74209]|uniref:Aldo/keto reductase-like protein n=1 Tax=Delitschia confertaspora ATCC 74209 TaxID=1513339 RepID=A0A9P4JFA4_9PLEO|nr:aldo/keto reductase-like protein [Delitschia confertaspora ATCC 74209]
MVQLVGKEVGNIGYGLMGLTWRKNPPSQDQSLKALKAALTHGCRFWNGGELYGTAERNSLHLLNEYFTKYPEDAEKVVLSIKGGLVPGTFRVDGSKEGVRRSIDECLSVLDGKKTLDLFECARVDKNVPIEETIEAIAEYVKAGKLGGISLSEVSAKSIRRAAKVHKIAAVEVELSLWSTEILENGVAQVCAELDIPIIAYSPLGRGFLTGQIKSYDDIPDDSESKHWPRFQPDVFDNNLKLVKEVEELASKKGCTPAQIAIGWILSISGKNGLPKILPIPGATTEERIAENTKPVSLNEEDLATIDKILESFTVQGDRYPPHAMALVDE